MVHLSVSWEGRGVSFDGSQWSFFLGGLKVLPYVGRSRRLCVMDRQSVCCSFLATKKLGQTQLDEAGSQLVADHTAI